MQRWSNCKCRIWVQQTLRQCWGWKNIYRSHWFGKTSCNFSLVYFSKLNNAKRWSGRLWSKGIWLDSLLSRWTLTHGWHHWVRAGQWLTQSCQSWHSCILSMSFMENVNGSMSAIIPSKSTGSRTGDTCGGVLCKAKILLTGSTGTHLTCRPWKKMDGWPWNILSLVLCKWKWVSEGAPGGKRLRLSWFGSMSSSKVQWSLRPLIFQWVICKELTLTMPSHLDSSKWRSSLPSSKAFARNWKKRSQNQKPRSDLQTKSKACSRAWLFWWRHWVTMTNASWICGWLTTKQKKVIERTKKKKMTQLSQLNDFPVILLLCYNVIVCGCHIIWVICPCVNWYQCGSQAIHCDSEICGQWLIVTGRGVTDSPTSQSQDSAAAVHKKKGF